MRGVFDEMTAVRWACGTEDGSHQRPLYGAATASNVAHGLFHSSGGMITPGGDDPGGDHGKPNTRRTSGVHAKGGASLFDLTSPVVGCSKIRTFAGEFCSKIRSFAGEFYNKTPSHDTGHGTGAHWHEHRYKQNTGIYTTNGREPGEKGAYGVFSI